MSASRHDRLPVVDVLKALACLAIVLHHLAFYGPMADRAARLAPDLVAWFAQHGRLAVQVFLVVGGFLAARALAPEGRLVSGAPLRLVAKRYARLAIPYVCVLALAVAAAGLARALMDHPSVPAAPSAAQLLAHVLLLQDVLGIEALSAGLWYVAIDFQLFAMFVLMLWLGTRRDSRRAGGEWVGPALVAALGCASLFVFNRVAALDVWAPYFFASYAMGAIAYWISSGRETRSLWLVPLVLVTLAALALELRPRIAVALGVTVVLAVSARGWMPAAWAARPVFRRIAGISYSVFLVHFPVCLVVNAVWTRFLPEDSWVDALGLLVALVASVAAGALFHRHIESRGAALAARAGSLARRLRIRPRLTTRPGERAAMSPRV
jgi:peptidoglycan/LPS O-acetylase OafA/YrhL